MGYHLTSEPRTKTCTPETAYPRFAGRTPGRRVLQPDTGRWLSRDPIEEQGGLNVYGFVGNDSPNRIDPRGLFCWTVPGSTKYDAPYVKKGARVSPPSLGNGYKCAYYVCRKKHWTEKCLDLKKCTLTTTPKQTVTPVGPISAEIAGNDECKILGPTGPLEANAEGADTWITECEDWWQANVPDPKTVVW